MAALNFAVSPSTAVPAPVAPAIPTQAPVKPPRPRGLLGMLLAAMVVVCLPFVYVAFLVMTGWVLVETGNDAIEEYTLRHGQTWWVVVRLCSVGVGAIIWVLMFKPLLTRRPRRPAAMELKPASQGDLFQLIGAISRATGSTMPADVFVDCSMGARAALARGLWSLLTQRTRLTFGLPLAASATSKEFAGALANEMGRTPAGIYGRLTHLVRIMNDWLTWVAVRIDPWEDALAAASGAKKKRLSVLKKAGRTLVWISQRPIWAVMWIGRVASRRALRNSVFNGDRCEAVVVGSVAVGESLQRQPHLQAAWEHACASVQLGLVSERLPDNFPQSVARHAASVQATAESVKTWEIGTIFCPSASLRAARARKLEAAGGFALQGNGAGLIRDFNELARQATQAHYQRDLKLNVTLFRLVAPDEVVNQKRKHEDRLAPVRRYFLGLVHPERALCGNGGSNSIKPEASAYRIAISEGRDWMRRRGDQMRMTLREWQLSWQRIRDLEMAHAYALAGLPVDSHQYGVSAHLAELYREEIDRQTMVCEVSEDPLMADEARLETRFAAALGLLWEAQPSELPGPMAAMRAAVPEQAVLYQALADKLKPLRNLVTFASAFESLGTKFGTEQPSGTLGIALKFLVPRMVSLTQDILEGLDVVDCPPSLGFTGPNVAAYLIGQTTPERAAMLQMDWKNSPPQTISREAAVYASEVVAPIMDRFIDLYHRTFSALASAAEIAEMQLAPEDIVPLEQRDFSPGYKMRTSSPLAATA